MIQNKEEVAVELLRINADMVKDAILSIKKDVRIISDKLNEDMCPRMIMAESEIGQIKDSLATIAASSAITKTKADKTWGLIQKVIYGMAGIYIFVKIIDEMRLYSFVARIMRWN